MLRCAFPRLVLNRQTAAGDSAGGFGGNGGGGSPSAVSHIVRELNGMLLSVGGLGGNGGGGSPSATSLFLSEIDPATAARPTASRVTMSMRFMFVLQVGFRRVFPANLKMTRNSHGVHIFLW